MVEAAEVLAQCKGALCLGVLTTLSAEAAKALAQYKGNWLRLKGLARLSAEVATALGQYNGDVFVGEDSRIQLGVTRKSRPVVSPVCLLGLVSVGAHNRPVIGA